MQPFFQPEKGKKKKKNETPFWRLQYGRTGCTQIGLGIAINANYCSSVLSPCFRLNFRIMTLKMFNQKKNNNGTEN